MHVTLRQGEVRKWFRTYFSVTVEVVYSEAEEYVILSQNMANSVLMERRPPANIPDGHPDRFHLKVKHLAKDTHLFENVAEAKIYQSELSEHLERFKRFLSKAEDFASDERFEL